MNNLLDSTDKIEGDIIWIERSHSPPTKRDFQRADNLLKWKKLSDWAYIIKQKNLTIFSSEKKSI